MNPLGMVKNIVEAVGMDIAHVYEDLVFLEHNAFLLQFSESENEMQVHMNSEADKQVIDRDISSLIASARNHGMNFTVGRMYTLSQTDDQSIRLEFSEAE